MVDELTVCWAMISFGRCAGLAGDMEVTVVGAQHMHAQCLDSCLLAAMSECVMPET